MAEATAKCLSLIILLRFPGGSSAPALKMALVEMAAGTAGGI
ncbi:hypothetical protein [Phenylobacterium sp. J367]|nr:hypothetical protein [Phenylobacterium sp. J367]